VTYQSNRFKERYLRDLQFEVGQQEGKQSLIFFGGAINDALSVRWMLSTCAVVRNSIVLFRVFEPSEPIRLGVTFLKASNLFQT